MQIDEFCSTDSPIICSWVNDPVTLRLISGETGQGLTSEILTSWVKNSEKTFIYRAQQQPLAFMTASVKEKKLPPGYIELCHLIVSPKHRRQNIATILIRIAIRDLLKKYDVVVGRVGLGNNNSLALSNKIGAKKVTGKRPWSTDNQHLWFILGARPETA